MAKPLDPFQIAVVISNLLSKMGVPAEAIFTEADSEGMTSITVYLKAAGATDPIDKLIEETRVKPSGPA